MGFYIRKAFNFGPIRLNLSRSGLGASFGVKGARVGVGPKGTYIHMGRGGLYYRQYIDSATSYGSILNSPSLNYDLKEIKSANVDELKDIESEELVKELNRVQKYFEKFLLALIIAVILYWCCYQSNAVFWEYLLLTIFSIPVLLYARHIDVTNATVILNYDFESEPASAFSSISNAFKNVTDSQKTCHIEAMADIHDSKYFFGANSGGRIKSIRPQFSLPPRVQSNIKVPTLPAGRQTIYFFPDKLLVYSSNGVGAVSYDNLRIEVKKQKFVEQGQVPIDTKVISRTWRYANKKGGPDRRFKNNPEIPVVLYDFFELTSSNGLNQLFFFSRPNSAFIFGESLTSLNARFAVNPDSFKEGVI